MEEGDESGTIKTTWVVVSKDCEDCGGKTRSLVLNREPTEADKQTLHDKHGGKFCVRYYKGSVESWPQDGFELPPIDLERWE